MYGWNSVLVSGLLLVLMTAAIETGYRIGRRRTSGGSRERPTKDHVNTVLGSMLGVLGLVLAFSVSLALQRFEARSAAVVDEANAIGTTYLRAQLLPGVIGEEARALLQRYAGLRVQAGAIPLDREDERAELVREAGRVQDALWACARRAAAEQPNPVTTGLFVQSLNELIDSLGRRDAALRRHVPEVILLLLFGTFILTGGVLGYAAAMAGHRPSVVSYLLVALIVVLMFMIIDLDRPRRGLIRVDQSSLQQVKMMIDEAEARGEAAALPGTARVGAAKSR